ncbi:MAG: hypothetical protein AB1641_18685 [Thermodesulfobacteriota bacterium]
MSDESQSRITYSERPVKLTPEGLVCSCGAMMQFFTNHVSEREGRIVSKVYVCSKCNNEAGIKVEGDLYQA